MPCLLVSVLSTSIRMWIDRGLGSGQTRNVDFYVKFLKY